MAEVIILDMPTRLDIPPERVLDAAHNADLTHVVVLGYDKDGQEYFASSIADGGTVLWLMERAKRKLFEVADELGDEGA